MKECVRQRDYMTVLETSTRLYAGEKYINEQRLSASKKDVPQGNVEVQEWRRSGLIVLTIFPVKME